MRYHNPIGQSTALVKKDAILSVGSFREGISGCEDWELWMRLQRIGKFEAVDELLMDYYIHPGGISADPKRMLRRLIRLSTQH